MGGIQEQSSDIALDLKECLDVPLHELPSAFEKAEGYIVLHLYAALIGALETWCAANGVEFKTDSIQDTQVSIGHLSHLVLMTPDPSNTAALAVTIKCMIHSESKTSRQIFEFALDPVSPFNKIRIRTEERLIPLVDNVASVLAATINAAYKALEYETQRLIARENGELIEELYAVLRRTLPSGVSHKVWLYLIRKSHGIFVLDHTASGALLQQARDYGPGDGVSPSWVLSRIGGAFAPPEKTIDVQEVIPARKTLIYDPVKKPASDDLIIALPQHIMSGGGPEAVQPLLGLDHGSLEANATWLTAVYPQKLRPQIEEHLTGVGKLLLPVIHAYAEKTKRVGRSAPRKGAAAATIWGRFVGSLLSSLIKGIADP